MQGGSYNVAVGHNALYNIYNTDNNTAVGYRAGQTSSSGTNNTSLGENAQPSNSSNSNEVTLGNSSISALRCNQTSISSLSDARDKTEVVDLPVGLDFLDKVRPVKFKWQRREPDINDGKIRAGFIAQELQEVQKDFDYLDLVMDGNPDKLEAKQGNLIPVMVQAIKELSAKVKELESKLN